jgi:hypothetical protein
MGRLALTTAALVLGCGGSGAVGAHAETDAGIDATVLEAGATSMDGTAFASDALDDGTPGLSLDAGLPDVGPPVPCDAGDYFIVAGDDAGSQVLRGCAPDPARFLARTVCGEDYLCSDLHGCSDASVLDLRLQPYGGVASIGTYGTQIGSWTTGGSTQSVHGWVRIKTLPPDGGTVSGDYAVTLAEGGTLGGSFCVVGP